MEFSKSHPEVEILLVSMDFPEGIESKLKPFLAKNKINVQVVLLDDPDANTWIDKVDPEWSGALPYTALFNKDQRYNHEGPFKNTQEIEHKYQELIQ
jgi:hypothetical protein